MMIGGEGEPGQVNIRPDILGVLLVLVLQIAGTIWWASSINTKVDHLSVQSTQSLTDYNALRDTQIEILTELSAVRQALEDRGDQRNR